MKFSIRTYIIVSVLCFLILSAVQLFLVYNTYELKNERYYFEEKNDLKESYNRSTVNDKLFPGGQKIIDTFVYKNMQQLESLYKNKKSDFELFSQKIVDSIAQDLRKKESVTNFLQEYKKKKGITDSLEYALMFADLDIMFQDKHYISLYSKDEKYRLIEPGIQEKDGIRIGGTLKKLNKQNLVSSITVSSPLEYTYRCNWAL